jgi:peroxiredoxin
MTPSRVPDVVFQTRVRNDSLGGPNPFEWESVTSAEIFGGKRVVLFALPGAYTPSCSDSHLPGYETRYEDFQRLGIDDVVCLAGNDAFVMFQWAKSRNIEKDRSPHGMVMRSWRYSMYVNDGAIEKLFVEPNVRDNPDGVGVTVSDAEAMLDHFPGTSR